MVIQTHNLRNQLSVIDRQKTTVWSSRNQYTPQVIHTTVLHSSIEQMIPKVSGACYAVWSMVNTSNINSLKSIYYAQSFYYKIRNNFGGNSFNNGEIFTLQKQIIRTAGKYIGCSKTLVN